VSQHAGRDVSGVGETTSGPLDVVCIGRDEARVSKCSAMHVAICSGDVNRRRSFENIAIMVKLV
jgi:hypothetical protein